MSKLPRIYIMTARSEGHPYVLPKEVLPAGYHSQNFTGRELPVDWAPPLHTVQRRSAKLADAIGYQTSFPLFSKKAVELLRVAAPGCAEFRLFTEVKGEPYFLMNVLVSADILDEAKSECTRTSTGVIVTIVRHSFRSCASETVPPIFKLPGRFDSSIFVTDVISELVVNRGLTGFQFRDPGKNPIRDLFLGKDVNVVDGVLP